ncbi:MAG: class I SAM-dependent methyltransferase [Syntrophobacteraceae bacterium]|nr:class I SAM-dependent methyltransferase [Syntrophobacteraceae bacterium]
MGHIFSLADVERYERWFGSAKGKRALEFEQGLFSEVWRPVSAQRVLEVGCGAGVFLEWFRARGHMVTGLDPSSVSLELARERLGNKVRLTQGFAEDLPFEDNEFDTVALITTLEFVDEPLLALKEAFRVARRNVLLGVLNGFSLGGLQYRAQRFWKRSIYSRARFFSVFKLSRMCEKILCGAVPIEWRTCFSLPPQLLPYFQFLERLPLVQRNPFGLFIAMRVDMQCRVRTVQTPVFEKLPAGVKVSAHSPGCWRSCAGPPQKSMDM